MAVKTIFVALTAAFAQAICTDHDPNHPNGPDVVITQGKGDRDVFEVSANAYVKDKIREGILEEVPDFDGTPRNNPGHPDHIDNPDNPDNRAPAPASAAAQPARYSEADVQGIVAEALAQQASRSAAGQQQAIDDAVVKALAQQTPKKTDT